jgi:hypothetical protein
LVWIPTTPRPAEHLSSNVDWVRQANDTKEHDDPLLYHTAFCRTVGFLVEVIRRPSFYELVVTILSQWSDPGWMARQPVSEVFRMVKLNPSGDDVLPYLRNLRNPTEHVRNSSLEVVGSVTRCLREKQNNGYCRITGQSSRPGTTALSTRLDVL